MFEGVLSFRHALMISDGNLRFQIRTGHWKAMQWASQTWARLNMVLIPDLDMLRWAAEKGFKKAACTYAGAKLLCISTH